MNIFLKKKVSSDELQVYFDLDWIIRIPAFVCVMAYAIGLYRTGEVLASFAAFFLLFYILYFSEIMKCKLFLLQKELDRHRTETHTKNIGISD